MEKLRNNNETPAVLGKLRRHSFAFVLASFISISSISSCVSNCTNNTVRETDGGTARNKGVEAIFQKYGVFFFEIDNSGRLIFIFPDNPEKMKPFSIKVIGQVYDDQKIVLENVEQTLDTKNKDSIFLTNKPVLNSEAAGFCGVILFCNKNGDVMAEAEMGITFEKDEFYESKCLVGVLKSIREMIREVGIDQ